MKTYLPQIERRIIVRPNYAWGILNYDLDNAYPQRMLELVGQSPTAKACWGKRTKYIGGNGFKEKNLGKVVVNRKGLTLAKILKATATDKALFTGFAWHFNYNANYKIAEVNFVKFEDVREGDTDIEEKSGKYAVYFDWGRKTIKNITTASIHYIHKYNPDPDVIKEQVIDAGGWDNYKGQLYYFNPQVDDYPLIVADEVWEDFETEAGIKILNNRQVDTGFMPSAIISQKVRREESENENPEEGENSRWMPSQIEKDMAQFQGAKNGQKLLFIEYEDDDQKPELTPFPIQNNDKLFQITEKSVEGRIIKGFMVPKELISSEKKGGLNSGGADKKEAIREFNDDTAPDRLEISEVFAEIFANFWTIVNPSNDWTILEVPGEVADDIIGKTSGQSINDLLISTLPKANKVAVLMYVYGFKNEEAEAMVPDDAEIVTEDPQAENIDNTNPDNE